MSHFMKAGAERRRRGVGSAGIAFAVGAAALVVLVAFIRCGANRNRDGGGTETHPSPEAERMQYIDGLPPARSAQTDRFVSGDACGFCHQAGGSTLRSADGEDVSPYGLWSTTMMAHSARDPYYLAVFAAELQHRPQAKDDIEQTCTRCHAPSASEELRSAGSHPSLSLLTRANSDLAAMGRDGVTCTLCHQIQDEGLGTDASFTGGYRANQDRLIYGPVPDPIPMPMQNHVAYTPVEAPHMLQSEMCATCHTVITRAFSEDGLPTGPAFAEQVPFFEWQNSVFAEAEGQTCQDCHLKTRDDDGTPYVTPLAIRPPWLEARARLGRHDFGGVNGYMLSLLAQNRDWVGTSVASGALRAAARRADAFLQTAATIKLESAGENTTHDFYRVRVTNQSGHKLPTGYPTRRAWLHLQVFDAADEVVWESGAFDERGALSRDFSKLEDARAPRYPHVDRVTRTDQVAMFHAEMHDRVGQATDRLLDAAGFLVDNRLLPLGWRPSGPRATWTAPVGTVSDTTFGAGGDAVIYEVPRAIGGRRIEVRLLYQSVPPHEAAKLAHTPLGEAFSKMVERSPPLPRIIAQASLDLAAGW